MTGLSGHKSYISRSISFIDPVNWLFIFPHVCLVGIPGMQYRVAGVQRCTFNNIFVTYIFTHWLISNYWSVNQIPDKSSVIWSWWYLIDKTYLGRIPSASVLPSCIPECLEQWDRTSLEILYLAQFCPLTYSLWWLTAHFRIARLPENRPDGRQQQVNMRFSVKNWPSGNYDLGVVA